MDLKTTKTSGTAAQSSLNLISLNLSEVIEDMFMVLTNKEKDVIVKRFSLNNQPRQTLESIGQHFNVTRERVRQIEKIALSKLRRTVYNTKLSRVNELAKKLIEKNGGVMLESKVINEISKMIYTTSEVDNYIVNLSLNIESNIIKGGKTNTSRPFWRLDKISIDNIDKILNKGIALLEEKGDCIKTEKLASDIQKSFESENIEVSKPLIKSVLEIDRHMRETEDGYGLMTWRHVNPRSIKDKAYIILKKEGKPMHFVEIANKISEVGFDKKVVTTQAVHNELIRYDQFVLVGRGLYALKEWGYQEGTVADVIEALLKKKSPLTKQEITSGVLKQRQVKKGTISLNLQKNTHFVRVGRAVYGLDMSKKV